MDCEWLDRECEGSRGWPRRSGLRARRFIVMLWATQNRYEDETYAARRMMYFCVEQVYLSTRNATMECKGAVTHRKHLYDDNVDEGEDLERFVSAPELDEHPI